MKYCKVYMSPSEKVCDWFDSECSKDRHCGEPVFPKDRKAHVIRHRRSDGRCHTLMYVYDDPKGTIVIEYKRLINRTIFVTRVSMTRIGALETLAGLMKVFDYLESGEKKEKSPPGS